MSSFPRGVPGTRILRPDQILPAGQDQMLPSKKDVHQISKELEQQFPKMEKPVPRLIKYLEILHDNHLIYWKGEKHK